MGTYSIKEFVGGPHDGEQGPDDGDRGTIIKGVRDRFGQFAVYEYDGDRLDGNVTKRLFGYRRTCAAAEIPDILPGFGSPP